MLPSKVSPTALRSLKQLTTSRAFSTSSSRKLEDVYIIGAARTATGKVTTTFMMIYFLFGQQY